MNTQEINEYLARKAMGWHKEGRAFGQEGWCISDGIWQIDVLDWYPAEDLNQAMMCAEKIRLQLSFDLGYSGWSVNINKWLDKEKFVHHIRRTAKTYIELPLTICEAIIEAME